MIKPLKGFVLIEPEEAEEVSAGGIILPGDAQEKPAKGTVLALGVKDGSEISVGDVVYFKKWAVDEFSEQGKTYKFVKYEDILGAVQP